MYGETDFTKVDTHEIQPHEYDELPEITDEMMARAVYSNGSTDLSRAVERLFGPSLRLDTDVAEALQSTGSGWEQRGNAALREWLKRQSV